MNIVDLANKVTLDESVFDYINILAEDRGIDENRVFGIRNTPSSYVDLYKIMLSKFQALEQFSAYSTEEDINSTDYDAQSFLILLESFFVDYLVDTDEFDITSITDGMQTILEEEGIKVVSCNNPQEFLSYMESQIGGDDSNVTSDLDAEIDKLKVFWIGEVKKVVDDVLNSYKVLYEAGYGLTLPAGILTNTGIKKSNSKGNIKWHGKQSDLAEDVILYKHINEIFGGVFDTQRLVETEDGSIKFPSISELGSDPYISYVNLHIGFLLGHLNYCKGNYGIKKFFTDNNIENANETKVVKYSNMEKWIKYTLERIVYLNYIECGVRADSPDDVLKYSDTVAGVNQLLKKCLKHVMVVTEKAKGSNTKVRVCYDSNENIESLKSALNSRLNTGSSDNIKVEATYYGAGVYEFNIITNYNGYKNNTLYAHQVLSVLEEQGIRPSWGNAIIGKDTNGNIARYNFRDRQGSVITIYGSMGSGKGVMTLSLLSAALGDNCDIMYIDGKPDSSVPIAELAWKNGVEAVVFNGRDDKCHLEGNPACKRTFDESRLFDCIPDGIFKKDGEQIKQFLLLNNYLRGIDLYIRYCKARSKGEASKDNWLVTVFDECQAMSSVEMRLNEYLYEGKDSVLTSIEKEKVEVDGKLKGINYREDERWLFITNYRKWKKDLIDSLKGDLLTITLRQADTSAIFIWQTTAFPDNSRGTVLGEFINAAAGQATKFIGTGAPARMGNTVYGTPNSLKDAAWYTAFENAPKGTWAVGKNTLDSSDRIEDAGMTLFRPFNVYSDTNGKHIIVDNAIKAGLTERDLIGVSLTEDLEVIPEVGFEGYVTRLLGSFGVSPATVLNRGYATIDEFLRTRGISNGILDFIYSFDRSISESPVSSENMDNTDFSFETGDESSFTPEYAQIGMSANDFDEEDVEYTEEENETFDSSFLNNSQPAPQDIAQEPIINPQTMQVNMNGQAQPVTIMDALMNMNSTSQWVDERGIIDMGKALQETTNILLDLIEQQFGGFDRIQTLTVKDGYLILNNVRVSPQIPDIYVQALPVDVRQQVASGRWAYIFIYGYTQDFKNLQSITIDTYDFFITKFLGDYGIPIRRFKPELIFKLHKNLVILNIQGKTITYENVRDGSVVWDSTGIRQACQSKEIEKALNRTMPKAKPFGLSDWYNQDKVQKALKTTKGVFGVGAITALTLAVPVVGVAVAGAVAHKKATDYGLGSRIKKGFSGFMDAFKENL